MLQRYTRQVSVAHKFQQRTVALKVGPRNLQFLWPFAFVFGHVCIFRSRFMGLLPTVFHYSQSAGTHPVPVMKWVLQWVDLNGHYSVFWLQGLSGGEKATVRAAWQGDRKRDGPADQPQNHKPSVVCLYISVRKNGESHFKAQ